MTIQDLGPDPKEAIKQMKLQNAELKRERDKFTTITESFDFTSLENGKDLLKHLGDNGMLWAAACSQFTKKKLDIDIPKEYLTQWFCNVIEHSWKLRKWREEQESELEDKLGEDN
jgi:hypothetical protein